MPRHNPTPTSRSRRRQGAHLQAPKGPAIAYTVELTHTAEAATLDELADLITEAHQQGGLARPRARDRHGRRPLSHDELLALFRRLGDRLP